MHPHHHMKNEDTPTPRTDALADAAIRPDGEWEVVPADFARQLERETLCLQQAYSEARSALSKSTAKLDDLTETLGAIYAKLGLTEDNTEPKKLASDTIKEMVDAANDRTRSLLPHLASLQNDNFDLANALSKATQEIEKLKVGKVFVDPKWVIGLEVENDELKGKLRRAIEIADILISRVDGYYGSDDIEPELDAMKRELPKPSDK